MRPSFKRFCQNIKCAEVGVHKGENALRMLDILPFAQFVLVDSYREDKPIEDREAFITKTKETLKDFSDRAVLLIEDSEVATKRFPDSYFDYIYIDAAHDYNSILRDLKCWYPKLKIGGTIGGHDVDAGGIKRALLEIFGDDWIIEEVDWYKVKR